MISDDVVMEIAKALDNLGKAYLIGKEADAEKSKINFVEYNRTAKEILDRVKIIARDGRQEIYGGKK